MGKVLYLKKGETHTIPTTGILASTLAVGSTVKLMENGSPVEYLVVNQGIPSNSSLYDSSCDGTWLLLKNRVAADDHAWHSTNVNDYKNSDIHAWLNSEYLTRFDAKTQSAIKQVKIPYVNGTSNKGSVASGSNGLSTKLFLLSHMEVGGSVDQYTYKFEDGAKLDYFLTGTGDEAKALRKWDDYFWWLRSSTYSSNGLEWDAGYISWTGVIISGAGEVVNRYGIRPCLVINSNSTFNENTLVLKG